MTLIVNWHMDQKVLSVSTNVNKVLQIGFFLAEFRGIGTIVVLIFSAIAAVLANLSVNSMP